MKWLSNECARHRQRICLQASGALPEAEQVEVESHLAACADCRNYRDEMKLVAALLVNWEKHFARITPSEAQQMRWAKAIKAAGESKRMRSVSPGLVLGVLWNELIWPCRRTWAGLAAVWLALALFNVSHSEHAHASVAKSSTPSAGMRLAFQEQERILAEILGPTTVAQPVEPPRRSSQPRSELKSIRLIG